MSSKIERMTVTTVAMPVKTVRNHGIGAVGGEILHVLVKLENADGLAGWGEASPWPAFTGTAEASA
ncbi:MAG: cycloisomerase, partial [Rhodospirillaceae bacterium]|nr:cycloisomerase [Rhodospirillaceae bacterium]